MAAILDNSPADGSMFRNLSWSLSNLCRGKPPPTDFAKLKQALQDLQQRGFDCDTLSMGMSHDYIVAVEEGATLVRVGSALFGSRL